MCQNYGQIKLKKSNYKYDQIIVTDFTTVKVGFWYIKLLLHFRSPSGFCVGIRGANRHFARKQFFVMYGWRFGKRASEIFERRSLARSSLQSWQMTSDSHNLLLARRPQSMSTLQKWAACSNWPPNCVLSGRSVAKMSTFRKPRTELQPTKATPSSLPQGSFT